MANIGLLQTAQLFSGNRTRPVSCAVISYRCDCQAGNGVTPSTICESQTVTASHGPQHWSSHFFWFSKRRNTKSLAYRRFPPGGLGNVKMELGASIQLDAANNELPVANHSKQQWYMLQDLRCPLLKVPDNIS